MTSGFTVVLPGAPETPTGGFVYDRHMLAALRAGGRLAETIVLAGDFPRPSAATLATAARRLAALPDGAAVVVDGLALTPLLPAFAAHAERLPLFALIHHPLADETGLAAAERTALFDAERRALALVRGVVVTSRHTAERLAAFAVPAERIRVVHPGTSAPRGGRLRRCDGPPQLLCVASLVPRKGQDILLRALATLRRDAWRLLLVGPARDRAFAGRLRRLARALRLTARVAFTGAVGDRTLAQHYRAADVFVLPSYYEGYGIVIAEAAAYGLPIVASDAGAIAEAAAGVPARLVPPGDAGALAAALRPLLALSVAGPVGGAVPGQARRGASGSALHTWSRAGREFVAALDALAAQR